MATLTSTKIKNTYDALLKSIDNDAIGTTAKQITDGLGNVTPLYVSTTQVGIGVTPESGLNLHVFGDAKIGSNLTVIGNLVVEGDTTTIDTETLSVEDPLIVLANNNTSTDAVDIGFYGKYTPSGTTLYSGLFREALTGKYRLFKGLEDEPTTTVNTSGTGYTKADLVIGNLETTQVDLSDDEKIRLGDNQELEIYHFNNDYSWIKHSGTQALFIQSDELNIRSNQGTETMITASYNGSVDLWYDASKKLETTSTGVSVTGRISNLTDPSAAQDAATKNYVDSQITLQDLDFQGDSGTGQVDLDSQTLTIEGTTNEIETLASSQTLTIGLPNDVTISSQLTVGASGSTDAPTIKAISASTAENILLEGTDTTAASAPDLVLYRNAGAVVDNDTLGVLEFRGRNNADTGVISYGGIYSRIIDASNQHSAITFSTNYSNTYTSGGMAFHSVGTNTPRVIIGSTDPFAIPTDTLDVDGTLNVSSTATFAGTVGIGETSPDTILHISDGNTSDPSTDAPVIRLQNTSQDCNTVFTDGDVVGGLEFYNDSIICGGIANPAAVNSYFRAVHDGTDSTVPIPRLEFGTRTLGITSTRMTIDSSGNSTFAGDVSLPDDKKLILGTGDDLQIYHDDSNSIIADTGTGDLRIAGNVVRIRNAADTENMISCVQNGAVTLAYDNTTKLQTTSTGVNVTGGVTADNRVVIDGVDTGNPSASANQLRVSGYGILGNRADIYVTNENASGKLKFGTGGVHNAATKMVIDSSGNVGIGTDSPDTNAKLDVYGGRTYLDATNEFTLRLSNTGTIGGFIGTPASGSLAFYNSTGSERMRITSGGFLKASNTGSYINSTGTYHEIRSNKNNSYTAILENTTTSNSSFAGLNIRYSGISPDATSNSFLVCEDSTAIRMRVYSDGDVWTSDAGTLTSDETLKNNITDVTSKLDDVMNLRVRNYYWNEDYHPEKTGKKLIGFIAQEFEQVFPNLVSNHIIKKEEVDEDGIVTEEAIYKKGIKEGKLIPILVKSMQEQQEIINDLKNRIETLENN